MKPGDICRTNLSQLGGLVKILKMVDSTQSNRQLAWIEHIEDHPYGYEKGTRGYYFLDELILVEEYSDDDDIVWLKSNGARVKILGFEEHPISLSINQIAVRVLFIDDSPYGQKAGEEGSVFMEDLVLVKGYFDDDQ